MTRSIASEQLVIDKKQSNSILKVFLILGLIFLLISCCCVGYLYFQYTSFAGSSKNEMNEVAVKQNIEHFVMTEDRNTLYLYEASDELKGNIIKLNLKDDSSELINEIYFEEGSYVISMYLGDDNYLYLQTVVKDNSENGYWVVDTKLKEKTFYTPIVFSETSYAEKQVYCADLRKDSLLPYLDKVFTFKSPMSSSKILFDIEKRQVFQPGFDQECNDYLDKIKNKVMPVYGDEIFNDEGELIYNNMGISGDYRMRRNQKASFGGLAHNIEIEVNGKKFVTKFTDQTNFAINKLVFDEKHRIVMSVNGDLYLIDTVAN